MQMRILFENNYGRKKRPKRHLAIPSRPLFLSKRVLFLRKRIILLSF